MTLHIFNPEHDIALASGLANFTAPHAGRQLRNDLGWLPALWAQKGDAVLVDNVEHAERAWRKVIARVAPIMEPASLNGRDIHFVPWKPSLSSVPFSDIQPWGWDKALCATLRRHGASEALLPSAEQLSAIRQLSHRQLAARLLPLLRCERTVGESFECTREKEVEALLEQFGQVVMKAPWSSSGRGLRFLSVDRTPFRMQAGWFRNLVASQGSVMVEPYYNKVKDFGMEFHAEADGQVHYDGLSLFHTVNGAYAGNILATESEKESMISRYIPAGLLNDIQPTICHSMAVLLQGRYQGPFGVDMMIVARPAADGFQLHPCVEINLRRTMGHVALALTPRSDDLRRVMRIEFDGTNYKLKIQQL